MSVRLSFPFAVCCSVPRVCCCGPGGWEKLVDCCTPDYLPLNPPMSDCSTRPHRLGVNDVVCGLQFTGALAERLRSAYSEFCSRHNAAVLLYKQLCSSDHDFVAFVKVACLASKTFNKLSPRGLRDDMPPADGRSTHGGSTSVRGRVYSPHVAKL